jgi:hypothetical protein
MPTTWNDVLYYFAKHQANWSKKHDRRLEHVSTLLQQMFGFLRISKEGYLALQADAPDDSFSKEFKKLMEGLSYETFSAIERKEILTLYRIVKTRSPEIAHNIGLIGLEVNPNAMCLVDSDTLEAEKRTAAESELSRIPALPMTSSPWYAAFISPKHADASTPQSAASTDTTTPGNITDLGWY